MKALTNILTRLLMLMLLMLVACTEETAEVDNLTRGEQYVQVRMQVPGMTAATTRAADGEITSVTALAFDTNGNLLEVVSATNITTERFNLTVPNGTKNIHFLANLPENYDLSGVQKESDLTTLTTNDYNNLVYWGMTTYEGTTNTLSTTLYRNMAKITLAPDEEFPFEGELTIAGLTNPNYWGYLVPWKDGVYTDGRVPNEPDPLTLTPIGKDGDGYGTSLYVLEHDNPNTNDGLYVICRIGDAFYKVALTSNGIDPYKIKRNHEYIIYVSDVDDYQADEYRTAIGDNIKDDYGIAAGKKPINLKVKEVEQVAFNANATNINVNGNLTVTVDVPQDGTVTALTISAPGFTIKQGETPLGNDGSYTGSDLTITGNNTTYTFVPNTFGQGKEITFTASGTNLQETEQTISVNVTAAIYAGIENNSTLYYDQDNQTVTVNVTMPKGLSAISIGGAGNFTITTNATGTFENNVYTRASATTEETIPFEFTLDKSKYTLQQGDTSATFTFSDARMVDESDKATQAPVSVNLKPTFTYIDNPTLNMNNNETYTVTMNVGGSLTSLSIAAEGFTVASSSGELTAPTNNVYSYAGGTTTFTFTPTSAGSSTIRFYDGQGENINVPEKNIIVTVNATIIAEADKETIYHDGNDKTVTVSVIIPKGVSGLNISATNFSYGDDSDGVYTYGRTDGATTETTVQLAFTLKDDVIEDSSITFSDASSNPNVTDKTVVIYVEATPQQGEEVVLWGDDEKPKDMDGDQFVITEEDLSGKTVYFEIMTLVETGHAEFQVLNKWTTNFEIFSAEKGTLDYNTNESQIIDVDIPSGREGLGIRAYNIKLIKVYYYSTE